MKKFVKLQIKLKLKVGQLLPVEVGHLNS